MVRPRLPYSLATKMGERLGQQIVVGREPGGAGDIGSEIGAKGRTRWLRADDGQQRGVVKCSLQILPSARRRHPSQRRFDITHSNAKELADFVKVEIVNWAKVVKDSGAKAE